MATVAQRIAVLEAALLPKPERQPFDYDAYVRLSKDDARALMGPMFLPNGDINTNRYNPLPAPEHCISREQYEAMTWSSHQQCTKWIFDRCSMYGSNSVCLFMSDRVSGDTMSTGEQAQALSTTFEGFDLSDIAPKFEMLTTDFVVHVIETVNYWRSVEGKSVSLIRPWDWTSSVNTDDVERFKKRRANNGQR